MRATLFLMASFHRIVIAGCDTFNLRYQTDMATLLVIRRNRLGDAVSVLPWLQGLREKYPDLRVDVLTNPYAAAVFKRSVVVDTTYVLPEEHWGMPIGILWHPTLRQLRKQVPYDYVVSASYSFSDKASVLAYLVPGRRKIGMSSGEEKLLDKVWDVAVLPRADVQAMHQVMRVAHVGWRAGLAVDSLPEPVLLSHIPRQPHRITLCPSVNRPQSSWSDAHWVALGQCLSKDGYAVAWIGHKPMDASGELLVTTSSDGFFDAIASSGMVVCCEGGTSHIASALGVPTIVLSGMAIRSTWCPWTGRAVVLERTGMINAIVEGDVMLQIRHWQERHQFLAIEHANLNAWLSEDADDLLGSKAWEL